MVVSFSRSLRRGKIYTIVRPTLRDHHTLDEETR